MNVQELCSYSRDPQSGFATVRGTCGSFLLVLESTGRLKRRFFCCFFRVKKIYAQEFMMMMESAEVY